jgi:sulfur-oxidizing protein SoxX
MGCRWGLAGAAALVAGLLLIAILFDVPMTGGVAAQPATPAASAPPMPGEAIAFDRSKGNCLTCHVIEGGDAPGNVGPQLSDMKKRYPDRAKLAAIIYDETKRNPLTVMPPFGRNLILTDQEIQSVIDFLYTR